MGRAKSKRTRRWLVERLETYPTGEYDDNGDQKWELGWVICRSFKSINLAMLLLKEEPKKFSWNKTHIRIRDRITGNILPIDFLE
jgi:hypothetical protein